MRIIATVPVFNECDIIDQVLDHLCKQGISFVILDGGSQDGSIEIALSYRNKGLLEHKIMKRKYMIWALDLQYLIKMASKYNPDWILCNDADEFLEPPDTSETLHDAIIKEDRSHFNIIQFDHFDFHLTERDHNSNEKDVRKKLCYYTWSDDFRYKAWKYYSGTKNHESGGHYPSFPNGIETRVSPKKFVMRHYRFRSPEQALRRVFKERLPRYSPEERAMGWHFHYDHCKRDQNFFISDSKMLSRYNGDGKWDLTKKFYWVPNARLPTREEIFKK